MLGLVRSIRVRVRVRIRVIGYKRDKSDPLLIHTQTLIPTVVIKGLCCGHIAIPLRSGRRSDAGERQY